MEKQSFGGSELHRLQPMREDYDKEMFERLYKICKPVIRNLSRQIDLSRFNVSLDIIQSYFWDKMLFVFNKYYGTCTEEHLKASILASLATFKNKLLRFAYTEQAEWNRELNSFEDLYDDDKEIEDDTEESEKKEEMSTALWNFMKNHLSDDGMLVFEVLMAPPPYIKERLLHDDSRITNILLVEFFDMPKQKKSVKYIGELREDIDFWIKKARHIVHRYQRRVKKGLIKPMELSEVLK